MGARRDCQEYLGQMQVGCIGFSERQDVPSIGHRIMASFNLASVRAGSIIGRAGARKLSGARHKIGPVASRRSNQGLEAQQIEDNARIARENGEDHRQSGHCAGRIARSKETFTTRDRVTA